MKRKHFLNPIFLILIFGLLFILNVCAKMYYVIDNGGNIIRITDQPVLTDADIEAGYKLHPPPKEEDAFYEGKDKGLKLYGILPEKRLKEYTLRNTYWGMGKEQVKEAEKESIFLDEDVELDVFNEYDGSLLCSGEFNGIDFEILYLFLKNRLLSARFRKFGDLRLKEEYINYYKNVKKYFTEIYDKTFGIDTIEENPTDPFAIIYWENPTKDISAVIFLYTNEEKGQIYLDISFEGAEGRSISSESNQISKGKTELRDYQSESAIKVLDWTSRLSKTGNYYYVEGKVKNISSYVIKSVRVKIEALDKYGKLVSLKESYIDPSILKANQTGFFSTMVDYDSKIDKFSLNVYWN
jgi:hypothetical protein